jgi:serine/threonine-protein phosphatase 5
MRLSEQYKQQGNIHFYNQSYRDALKCYQEGLLHDSWNYILYSNQAKCYLNLREFEEALTCSNKSIEINPSFFKAYIFKSEALFLLQRHSESILVLENVLKADPQYSLAKIKRDEFERKLRAFRFLRAIHVPEVVLNQELIQSLFVMDSYTGLRVDLIQDINIDFVLSLCQDLKNGKVLHKRYVLQIMLWAREIMKSEDTLVRLTIKDGEYLTICGDIHGQFLDLVNIFQIFGNASEIHHYLFNGDFVDRGPASFEVVMVLLSLKIAFPRTFHLSRGNHESSHINKIYGFEKEIESKYPEDTKNMFNHFQSVFNSIPLAYTIQNRFFVTHGGIGSGEISLDDINRINRFKDPSEDDSIMHDLLWADPGSQNGIGTSMRGAVSFGPDITDKFLSRNGLHTLIRSHEFQKNGYKIDHNGKCITVFSAPNYMEEKNEGAVIQVFPDGTMKIEQFESIFNGNKSHIV